MANTLGIDEILRLLNTVDPRISSEDRSSFEDNTNEPDILSSLMASPRISGGIPFDINATGDPAPSKIRSNFYDERSPLDEQLYAPIVAMARGLNSPQMNPRGTMSLIKEVLPELKQSPGVQALQSGLDYLKPGVDSFIDNTNRSIDQIVSSSADPVEPGVSQSEMEKAFVKQSESEQEIVRTFLEATGRKNADRTARMASLKAASSPDTESFVGDERNVIREDGTALKETRGGNFSKAKSTVPRYDGDPFSVENIINRYGIQASKAPAYATAFAKGDDKEDVTTLREMIKDPDKKRSRQELKDSAISILIKAGADAGQIIPWVRKDLESKGVFTPEEIDQILEIPKKTKK